MFTASQRPPFAPPAFGDAGEPGALTQVFLVLVVPAHRPALVAASANVWRADKKSLEGARRPRLPV